MSTDVPRLLLVTPGFHGYGRSIAEAFARRAAERRRLADRALAAVRELRPERLVVIKGDALDDRIWEETARIPRILWLYDDLHRHDYTTAFLREVGPVVDFAESETAALRAAGVDALCVPDAFDPHRARTFSWRRPSFRTSREVPLERAYQLHADGAAGIAIHGLQNGHAMRTFEIPGTGGVQLVDREDVSRYDDIGTEVALWRDLDELAELGRLALTDRARGESLRAAGRARTLAKHTFDHRIQEVDSPWP